MNNSYGTLTAPDLLEWAKVQTIGGEFALSPAITTGGLPQLGSAYYTGTLEVNLAGSFVTLRVKNMNDLSRWENCTTWSADNKLVWTGWVQNATATPPQEYDLPLADGAAAQNPCRYFKSQEHIVTVHVAIRATKALSAGQIISALPAGYRPNRNVEVPATLKVPYGATSLIVSADGNIKFFGTPMTEGQQLYAVISFVAS